MAPRSDDERLILDMFRYMRPAGTATEQVFVDKFLTPLGFERDKYRNLVLIIGDRPRVLFSSHMDTVHRSEGLQTLSYQDGVLELSKAAKRRGSNCLGADDTAGIWLMTEMIKAGVEGVYVIHHAEESGCIGSTDLAKGNPAFFEGIDYAVAFDRAYDDDVITHQMGRRTCSDGFAKALAKSLGGKYKPSDGGAYTDTNEYAQLVSECTNVSVGYVGQHTSNERQDVHFLIELRDKLLTVHWAELPVQRDPSAWDDADDGYFWGRNRRSSYSSSWADYNSDVTDLVKDYPDVVASILEAYGIGRHDIMDEVSKVYGYSTPPFETDKEAA